MARAAEFGILIHECVLRNDDLTGACESSAYLGTGSCQFESRIRIPWAVVGSAVFKRAK